MTQYHNINIKLSDSQLDKLKLATQNAANVILTSLSNFFSTQVIDK